MLDLIIPILFVVILFVSKQVVNKVLPTQVESDSFPEGEVFPEIETDDFLNMDKKEEQKKIKRSPRRNPKETPFGKSYNSLRQSSSVESVSSPGRTCSIKPGGVSSVKGSSEIAKMLRTSNGARRAFIYSELFNRKYE